MGDNWFETDNEYYSFVDETYSFTNNNTTKYHLENEWFVNEFGFVETSFDETKQKFQINGNKLILFGNNKHYDIGTFFQYSLAPIPRSTRSRVSIITGDIQNIIKEQTEHIIIQVASQLNCLEHTSPRKNKTHGITCYIDDYTQGPAACLMCPAALVYRNYFLEDQCLIDNLCENINMKSRDIVQNGYVIVNEEQLKYINDTLNDEKLKLVNLGVHENIETINGNKITQVFCSAMPCAYNYLPINMWEPTARFFLRAYYQLTLNYAVHSKYSNKVILTLLGDGAFKNKKEWIYDALEEALTLYQNSNLDIYINCYGYIDPKIQELVDKFITN